MLVAGLLALGRLAGQDGLFDAAASRLVRLPVGPLWTFVACMSLLALTTALLNLDTTAVFLTPVLIGVARRRRLDPAPFLYAAIFMANASSLFLPGSNLTNLLVLRAGQAPSGGSFFVQMLPSALAACLATGAGLIVIHRHALRGGLRVSAPPEPWRAGAGLTGVVLAGALTVLLADPAPAVAGLALVLTSWRAARERVSLSSSVRALGLPVLIVLFLLTTGLGVLARSDLLALGGLRSAGALPIAALAALASVLINNLPASALLSGGAHLPSEPLLIGLDLGPNLALSGSLAALLWWRAASAAGLRPSVRAFFRQGLVLAPPAIGLALLVSGH